MKQMKALVFKPTDFVLDCSSVHMNETLQDHFDDEEDAQWLNFTDADDLLQKILTLLSEFIQEKELSIINIKEDEEYMYVVYCVVCDGSENTKLNRFA